MSRKHQDQNGAALADDIFRLCALSGDKETHEAPRCKKAACESIETKGTYVRTWATLFAPTMFCSNTCNKNAHVLHIRHLSPHVARLIGREHPKTEHRTLTYTHARVQVPQTRMLNAKT